MDIRITGKDYMEEMLRLQSRVKELETKVEKFENGITYYDKVQELVSRILNMESDLTLNASMLARQCDLAREAEARVSNLLSQHEIASQQIQIWEARVKELEDAIRKHRSDSDDGGYTLQHDRELYAHLAEPLTDVGKRQGSATDKNTSKCE